MRVSESSGRNPDRGCRRSRLIGNRILSIVALGRRLVRLLLLVKEKVKDEPAREKVVNPRIVFLYHWYCLTALCCPSSYRQQDFLQSREVSQKQWFEPCVMAADLYSTSSSQGSDSAASEPFLQGLANI